VCFVAFRRAVERVGGRHFADDEIRALFGPSEEGMLQRAMPARWQEGLAVLLEEYERHLPLCPQFFPSVTAALDALREQGIPLALVTGKGPHTTAMSLKHFALDQVFDVVETGSPQGVVKAAAIARVVDRWRLPAADIIYVGDAVADMLAAREAGVVAVGAAWAPTAIPRELESAGADRLFTSAEDFRAWVLG